MAVSISAGFKPGMKVVIRATISRTGTETAHGTGGKTRLLVNVKLGKDRITDHMWVRDPASVAFLKNVPVGTLVELEGVVLAYEGNASKLSVEHYTSMKVVAQTTLEAAMRLAQSEDRQVMQKTGKKVFSVIRKNGSMTFAANADGQKAQMKKEYA